MYVRREDALIEVQTPAKVNLFLEILGRRADGYHEIETLMTPISLYDSLSLAPTADGPIRLTCSWAVGRLRGVNASNTDSAAVPDDLWPPLPQGDDNLVVKTLEALRSAAGTSQGADVRLVKRIPAAAGLGGASSDAAAALVAANLAWELGWSRPPLAEVAAQVGSDVAFFLYGGPAVCRGRGERIEPVSGCGRWPLVVVRPPAGLATAEVYRSLRDQREAGAVAETPPQRVETIVAAARSGNATAMVGRLFNRLQPIAERLSPWIARLRAEFERLDCLGHQMSGSGTSYFGICRHARHARRVAARLRAAGLGAVLAATTL